MTDEEYQLLSNNGLVGYLRAKELLEYIYIPCFPRIAETIEASSTFKTGS